jgi:hypothetical protein
MKDVMKRRLARSDLISGVVLTLLGCFAVVEASQLPFGRVSAPDAGFFPIALSVMLTAIGAAITARSLLVEPLPMEFSARSWLVPLTAGLFLLYALCLQVIGYVVCTLVILMVLTRGLGGVSWTRSLLLAVPSVLLSYFGFLELGVPLPRGILPF